MNTIRTDVNVLLRSGAPILYGRTFPFGEFSCTPLLSESSGPDDMPLGFLLSKGNAITIISPEPDGSNTEMWDCLISETSHWHACPTDVEELPAECWYG